MLDSHIHIVYDFDDGPKSIEESREILNESKKQGVDKIVSTSHCYFNKDINEWVKERDLKLKELNDPRVLKGAEVYYYDGISNNPDLDKLCIEGTNLLLLEMPFKHFTNRNINELLVLNRKYQLIIAHINRYLPFDNLDNLITLRDNNVLFQLNLEYFDTIFYKHRLKKLKKLGLIDYLGSDAHNTTNRRIIFDKIYPRIEKTYSKEFIEYLNKLKK